MANNAVADKEYFSVAAQNCYHKVSGAYTGEVSADMIYSVGVRYCIVGHSERREYFKETNKELAQKLDNLLQEDITPIFCCGESLDIREAKMEKEYVETQLKESLYHLNATQVSNVVIAYEPVWAIGTGKTATSAEAQEMHEHIRSLLAKQYGNDVADHVSILYGGSVKASNAKELFALPDVDGGLVGGASLMAQDFIQIIKALK
jgi:triosephosphate isomerase